MSLRQTLDLVRTVVDVVEARVESLAGPGDEQLLRESVLRFSREIAFAAAEVYAGAAEARGAWDARLEALVVDAVLRGEADDSMQSRAAALGWDEVGHVTVVVGTTPTDGGAAASVDALRRAVRHEGGEALAIVQRTRLIAILGGTEDPLAVVSAVSDGFGEGPIVVGPTVPHLFAAGRSARAALSGLSAAAAWPAAPRIVESQALLPERALAATSRRNACSWTRSTDPSPGRRSARSSTRPRPTSRAAARSRRRPGPCSSTPTRSATGSAGSRT